MDRQAGRGTSLPRFSKAEIVPNGHFVIPVSLHPQLFSRAGYIETQSNLADSNCTPQFLINKTLFGFLTAGLTNAE